jgi:RimJ/RimL family protein N-acetyltransferase
MYIVSDHDADVGQIRIEHKEGIYLINFSIAPGMRGKGYGTKVISEVSETLKKDVTQGGILRGLVKLSNVASIKAFLNSGFAETKVDQNSLTFEKRF